MSTEFLPTGGGDEEQHDVLEATTEQEPNVLEQHALLATPWLGSVRDTGLATTDIPDLRDVVGHGTLKNLSATLSSHGTHSMGGP